MDASVARLKPLAAIAFAVACIAVAILSLLPGREMPSLDVWDKAQHFAAYAALGGLGALAFWRPDRSWPLPLTACLALLGVALELGQAFSPGRQPETGDAIANVLGAGTGVVLMRSIFLPLYVLAVRCSRGRRARG